MTDELSEAEAAVLDVLQEGRATTGYIVEQTGYSGPHINTQLKLLRAKNNIQRIHEPTALYELTHDPREE